MKLGDLVIPSSDLRGLWLDYAINSSKLGGKNEISFRIEEGTRCVLLEVLKDEWGQLTCKVLTPSGKIGYVGRSYLEVVE